MRRAFLATLAAASLAVACTGAGPTGSGPTGIAHPTGATELVVRIDTGGGFVAPSVQLGHLPELSIFGDGRVVAPGPQIEIYPGPALPNLVTFRISEDGLQKVLENARAAGLLGTDAHYDYPGIADAPTTTFTVTADGRTHVVSAYALTEGGANDGQLDPTVRQARAALLSFKQRAIDLRSWLGSAIVESDSAFQPFAIRIFASPAQPDQQGGIEPNIRDWPLSTGLAAFGTPFGGSQEMRCGVVSGSDLTALLPALQASNQLTFWRSGGDTYQLTLRPLLPDESGCPSSL